MNRAQDGRPMPSPDDSAPESAAPQTVPMDVAMEMLNRKSFGGAEKFDLAMERFTVLNTEMITLLMGLSEEINKSAEELNAVRAAIDLKKKEFAALQAAEQTFRALRQQTDDLIKHKNELERLISDQRNVWEEEKEKQAREEDERRKIWNSEQFKARQELEEELRSIRHRHQAVQEEAERDFIERDMMLKKKEFEWSQLIQELDQFLSKLAGRFHPHPVAHRLPKEESAATTEVSLSGIPLSGYLCEETGRTIGDNESDLGRGEPSMWDSIWGEKDYSFDEKNYLLGQSSAESSKAFHYIHRDEHVEQNGRVEDSDSSAKKDNVPLKFAPKNSNNCI